jgi:hypothetical protein
VHANLLGAQQIFKREMEKEERKKNSLCPQRGSKDPKFLIVEAFNAVLLGAIQPERV